MPLFGCHIYTSDKMSDNCEIITISEYLASKYFCSSCNPPTPTPSLPAVCGDELSPIKITPSMSQSLSDDVCRDFKYGTRSGGDKYVHANPHLSSIARFSLYNTGAYCSTAGDLASAGGISRVEGCFGVTELFPRRQSKNSQAPIK